MPQRGRKPLPAAVKRVSGNPGRRPFNENEIAVDEPIGPAPKAITGIKRGIWNELCDAAPFGILTKADRILLETLTRLIFIMREQPERFNSAVASQIRTALACLAMEPSARTRFTSMRPPIEDPEVAKYFS